MKTTFARVITEDKLRLDGLLFEPESTPKGAVLHVHGMAGNFYENAFLDEMAAQYTEAGYAFLTCNNRGHDYIADLAIQGPEEKTKQTGEAFEKFEDCVLDIQAWHDFLRERKYDKIILQGHSLGSPKAIYYLYTKKPKDIQALVLASPADMLGLVRMPAEVKNFERDIREAEELVKTGKGRNVLSNRVWGSYYKSAESYINQFGDDSKANVFPTSQKGAFAELESFSIPILVFYGEKDDALIYSPSEDLEIISGHLKSKKAETHVIPGASHGYFGKEKEAAGLVADWLKRAL